MERNILCVLCVFYSMDHFALQSLKAHREKGGHAGAFQELVISRMFLRR